MTIEKSPPSTQAPKASARSDAHAVKGKPTGTDAGSAGQAGFLAILGTLGEDAIPDAPPTVPAGEALAGDPSALLSADTSAFDASVLLQQNPQIAAAQALLNPVGGTAQPQISDALQAAAMPVDGKTGPADGTTALGDKPLPGAEGRVRAGQQPGGADAGASMRSLAADEDGSSSTQSLLQAGAHGKKGKSHATGEASTLAVSATSTSTPTERPEVKDTKLLAALHAARAPEPTRAAEPILVPLAMRQEKSQGERASKVFQTSEPIYTGTALGVSGPEFSLSAAAPPAMAVDMQVAEQVTYWVSQKVQNAEMQLDGLGQAPVEVSISVQGNEAQITFRSDEVQTRGVLESAGMHLKDMLQREGVVLTGVSVGTSGRGDAGPGERRERQGARQVAIAPLKPATIDSGRGPRLQSGRSVDLFV